MQRDNLIFSRLNIAAADVMSDESSSSHFVKQVNENFSNKLQYAIEPHDILSVLPVKKSQAPSIVAERMVFVKFV